MPSLLTTAVAAVESDDAGMVIVTNWIDGDAVTVTVGAASAWPWPPAEDATDVVLVASLVGTVGCAGCVGCDDCAGWVDCVGCSVPGRVVCSVIEAGTELLVAEV